MRQIFKFKFILLHITLGYPHSDIAESNLRRLLHNNTQNRHLVCSATPMSLTALMELQLRYKDTTRKGKEKKVLKKWHQIKSYYFYCQLLLAFLSTHYYRDRGEINAIYIYM